MGIHLDRDERLSARVLHDAGWGYERVAAHLGMTERQARYACTAPSATPKKKTGRLPALTE